MSDIIAPVGLRYGAVFELNANGRPAATGLTAYAGLPFSGEKAYQLTIPEARRISHAGKDRIVAVDQLPSLETPAGEIRVSTLDYDIEALLTGVTKFAVSGAQLIGRNTDKQGSEPEVALLLYQQAKDVVTGLREWHFHIIPATRCLPIPAGMSENPEDIRYTLAPTPVTKHLWGTAFALLTEGMTEAAILDGHMAYKPSLEAFLADGVEDQYALLYTAANNTYSVWVDGVERTTNITKTTAGFTFTISIPAANADIVVFYPRAA